MKIYQGLPFVAQYLFPPIVFHHRRNTQPFEIADDTDLHKALLKMPESVSYYEDDDTFARLHLQGESLLLTSGEERITGLRGGAH